MNTFLKSIFLVAVALFSAQESAFAQSEPYVVRQTTPVITEGPYLVALSDTSVSVVWLTDTPCHSKIRITGGGVSREIEPEVDGLLPVGLRHAITINGLNPATQYHYQAISTRVVKLKPYWPEKGLSLATSEASFTTFGSQQVTSAFAVVTDTHEDPKRISKLMGLVDWKNTDALLHLGDAFDWIDTEDQIFNKWLRPTTSALGRNKPLFFARGNHEMRGAFARRLIDYLPTPEGKFYYSRELGPIHLLVLDTAEDKPDNTNVYAHLNKTTSYRQTQLNWLREQWSINGHIKTAPFRVIAMHQPDWGWLENGNKEWITLANQAKIDLIIAGHDHEYSYAPPNATHTYHLIVLGQDQLMQVKATHSELVATIVGIKGNLINKIIIPTKH